MVRFLLFVVLLFPAAAALADTITVTETYSSTVSVHMISPNDSYYGEYRNTIGGVYSQGRPTVLGGATVDIPFLSITVPVSANDIISINTFGVNVGCSLSTPCIGEGTVALGAKLNHDAGTTIAPTLQSDAALYVASPPITILFGPSYGIAQLSATSSTFYGVQSIMLNEFHGYLDDIVLDPGYNYDAYVTGNGDVTIPFTYTMSVTYTVTPEPATWSLLGTGVLGLAGFLRRRIC